MRQQINLYQPIFRAERKLFSAFTVAVACGLVVLAYLCIWGYGSIKVARLANAVQTLQARAQSQESMIATAAGLRAQRANPASIEASIAALASELSTRTRALDVLRSGVIGEPHGFSARLEALAHGHVQGVWLDHLVLTGAGGNLRLEGAATDADLVPRYLQSLANEAALSGARFAQFALERPQARDSGAIRFRASSAALIEQEKTP